MAAPTGQLTVLTAWTAALLEALTQRGLDARALAAGAGIPATAMAHPDHRIPLAASTRLWRAAVEATGDRALGLDVSRFVRPGTFHALGQAVLSSPTLDDALERVARYSRVTADVAVVTIERLPDSTTLVIRWKPGCDLPSFESIDAVLSSIVRTARFMLDRSVSPTGVHLERPRPADLSPYAKVFRCPLTFDADEVRLTYDRATVERSVLGGNAELARANDTVVASYLAGLDPDTVTRRVRTALVDLLVGGEADACSVARVLNMSTRTLQRQLQQEDTTFRDVLRDLRRDLAEAYLRAGEHNVTEITYLLGFSETATFSRAFKAWTGVSPSRFR